MKLHRNALFRRKRVHASPITIMTCARNRRLAPAVHTFRRTRQPTANSAARKDIMHSAPIFRRLAVAGMALAFVATGVLHQGPAAAGQTRSDPSEAEIDLFRAVMWIVKRDYVESVDDRKLVTQALKGMLSGLDAHSDYLSEAELKEMETTQNGVFGGFGLELTREDGCHQGGIADRRHAGGARRDPRRRCHLEGRRGTDRSIESQGRRGPSSRGEGDQGDPDHRPCRPRALRHHADASHHSCQIRQVASGTRSYRLCPDQHLQLEHATGARRSAEFLDKEADGHLNALVLDLRNDPGGLLRAAVEVAGDFTEGAVVSTRGRKATRIEMYFAPANDHRRTDIPMVVLINGATASASEIVAGALQDHHRATVLGTRSFGKASVQEIVPITNRGAVRLTIARYYTPSGRSIQGDGITPDVVVEPAKDQQAANSVPTHEAELPGALKNTGDLGPQLARTAPETESSGSSKPPAAGRHDRQINPKIIGTGEDDQLQAAIALLRTGAPAGAAHR